MKDKDCYQLEQNFGLAIMVNLVKFDFGHASLKSQLEFIMAKRLEMDEMKDLEVEPMIFPQGFPMEMISDEFISGYLKTGNTLSIYFARLSKI